MTILSLPGGVYPKAVQWGLEHNVGVSSGPLSQTQQRIQRDGGRWRADVTFPPLTSETGPLFAAYLDKASRGDMWTYLTPPHAEQRGNWGVDELVVNGDFTRDVSGWSAGSGAALNVNARRLRVKIGGSPGAVAIATQTGLATEADQPHVVMVDLVKGSTANWRIKLYPSGSPSQDEHVSYYEDEGRVVFVHIPETTSTTLELACNSMTEQDYAYFANASMARCLLVNDSLAIGNECDVKGGPTSQNGALRAGEFVTIQLWNGWQMVRLTEDLDTDSSGNGTIRFEPALRAGVKGGGAVVVHKPFVRTCIPAHSSPHNVDPPHFHGFAVSFVEDVTEIGITENPQDTDLIWYWDAHSYSLAPIVGTGTPTMTNGAKTYLDKNGLLKITALDADATGSPTPYEPAFDHDSAGALRGMVIEEARTNLLTDSNGFSAWSATECTVTANAGDGLGGEDSMSYLVPSTNAAAHFIQRTLTTTAQSHTAQLLVRVNSNIDKVTLFPGSSNTFVHFNLTALTTTREPQTTSSSIEHRGGGIYLLSAVWPNSFTADRLRIYASSGTFGSSSTAGDGVAGIFIENSQFEAGAFATSYIPTTSATVARAADVDTLATASIPGFSSSSLTMVAEVIGPSAVTSSNQSFAALTDGSINNSIIYGYNGSTFSARINNRSGGVLDADIGTSTNSWLAGVPARVAYAEAVNDGALAINGAATVTDAALTMPVGITTFSIGNRTNSNFINAPIRRLALFRAAKPRRQVRSLSA